MKIQSLLYLREETVKIGESQIGALRSQHKCRSDCGARASPMFFPQKDLSFAFGVALGLNQYHSSQTLARCGSLRRPHQTCLRDERPVSFACRLAGSSGAEGALSPHTYSRTSLTDRGSPGANAKGSQLRK